MTGADVILGYLPKCQALSEALTKQIPKKMMVSIPMPLVVQGHYEQVSAFEMLQGLLTGGFLPGSSRGTQNSVTQRAA